MRDAVETICGGDRMLILHLKSNVPRQLPLERGELLLLSHRMPNSILLRVQLLYQRSRATFGFGRDSRNFAFFSVSATPGDGASFLDH